MVIRKSIRAVTQNVTGDVWSVRVDGQSVSGDVPNVKVDVCSVTGDVQSHRSAAKSDDLIRQK
jgi:hypothetical protein